MKLKYFIIALVMVAAVACKKDKKKDKKGEAETETVYEPITEEPSLVEPTTETEATPAAEEVKPVVEEKKAPEPKPEPKAEVTKPEIEPAPKGDILDISNGNKQPRFFLIAGSFKNIENAKTFHKEMAKAGYDSKILYPVNDYNRVSLNMFYDEAEARSELAKIRKKEKDGTFWLLKM